MARREPFRSTPLPERHSGEGVFHVKQRAEAVLRNGERAESTGDGSGVSGIRETGASAAAGGEKEREVLCPRQEMGTGTLHERLFKVCVCVGESAKRRGAAVFGDVCRTGDRITCAV